MASKWQARYPNPGSLTPELCFITVLHTCPTQHWAKFESPYSCVLAAECWSARRPQEQAVFFDYPSMYLNLAQ